MEKLLPTIALLTEPGSTPGDSPDIDWSLMTWKGSRREQHQAYLALPFSRKLELNEAMCDQARLMAEQRRKQGLPYFDPYTGSVVRPETAKDTMSEEKLSESRQAD